MSLTILSHVQRSVLFSARQTLGQMHLKLKNTFLLLVLCTSRHRFFGPVMHFKQKCFLVKNVKVQLEATLACMRSLPSLHSHQLSLSLVRKTIFDVLHFVCYCGFPSISMLVTITILKSKLARPSIRSFHTLKITTTLRGVSTGLPIPANKQLQ